MEKPFAIILTPDGTDWTIYGSANGLDKAKELCEILKRTYSDCSIRAVSLLNADAVLYECGKSLHEIHAEELREIVDQMDLPGTRQYDVGWLNRNIHFNNKSDPELLSRASFLIRRLLRLGIRDISED